MLDSCLELLNALLSPRISKRGPFCELQNKFILFWLGEWGRRCYGQIAFQCGVESSVISDRYQQVYLSSYNRTYDCWQRQKEDEIARELAQNSKLITGEQVPRDQVFERGWRDGYDGKDTPPKGLSHDEVKTYERGHRSGNQHREWDLAQRLRQQTRGR